MKVGFNDHKYSVNEINGKQRKSYGAWKNMIRRCFDSKLQEEYPTYKGCTISDSFLNFSYFHEWCEDQIGYKEKGFHLDKDILIKGNKLYSPETCCFVPHDINTQFTMSKSKRGELPVGVSKRKGSPLFRAQIKTDGKVKSLGQFKTVEEAFQTYKTAKEAYIKELTNKWKDQIDPRVYEALIKYEVEITD